MESLARDCRAAENEAEKARREAAVGAAEAGHARERERVAREEAGVLRGLLRGAVRQTVAMWFVFFCLFVLCEKKKRLTEKRR